MSARAFLLFEPAADEEISYTACRVLRTPAEAVGAFLESVEKGNWAELHVLQDESVQAPSVPEFSPEELLAVPA